MTMEITGSKAFMLTIFVLATILMGLNIRIHEKLKKCDIKDTRNSVKGLLPLSGVITISSLLYVICMFYSSKCEDYYYSRGNMFPLMLLLLASVVLFFLAYIIGFSSNCSKVVRNEIISVIVISLVLALLFLSLLVHISKESKLM